VTAVKVIAIALQEGNDLKLVRTIVEEAASMREEWIAELNQSILDDTARIADNQNWLKTFSEELAELRASLEVIPVEQLELDL